MRRPQANKPSPRVSHPASKPMSNFSQTDSLRLDLVPKYNVPGPRYTSYPTAVRFSADTPRSALLADALDDLTVAPSLSLYVHIPFCESLCWYCACNTVTTNDHARSRAYIETLGLEAALWADTACRLPPVTQLHFGGGTPTFLTPLEIRRLGELLHENFEFAPDAEISVEMDPRRLTPGHVGAYRELGMNRVSFGVQDFDSGAQRAVNRLQTLEMTRDAITWAREAGCASVNLDLIYGLPGQTGETFSRTLDEVLRLAPDRLAVFAYAHVPWLRPAQRVFERAGSLPGPEMRLSLLGMAIERLTGAGYVAVGMDHFALPSDELARAFREKRLHRNFQGYSTRAGLSILGLGATAISQTPGAFRQNEKDVAKWGARIEAGEFPVERGTLLSDEDRRRRELIMGIMCDGVLEYDVLAKKLGVDVREHYAGELRKLAPLEADGLVRLGADRLEATPAGRLFLRNIAMAFDAYLPPPVPAGSQEPAPHHSRTV